MENENIFADLGKVGRRKKTGANKAKPQSIPAKQTEKEKRPVYDFEYVDQENQGIKIVRSFLKIANKSKPIESVVRLFRRIQKMIAERIITKKSAFHKEVDTIQHTLVKALNNARGQTVTVAFENYIFDQFYKVSRSEKVRPSVGYLKRYVSLIGKPFSRDLKKSLESMLNNLDKMVQRKLITKSDPYFARIKMAYNAIQKALKTSSAIKIESTELNGLNGIIQKESDNSFFDLGREDNLTGFEQIVENQKSAISKKQPQKNVLSAEEFGKMEFESMELSPYWEKILGDIEPNCFMIVYGRKFQGKSVFLLTLANYFATHHGKVLYIWPEQYCSKSGRKQILELNLNNTKNLLFANELSEVPQEIFNASQFIFVDSASDAGYSAQEIETIIEKYPQKGWIFSLQSTKTGSFRGSEEFAHLPDVLLKIEDRQIFIEKNRHLSFDQTQTSYPIEMKSKLVEDSVLGKNGSKGENADQIYPQNIDSFYPFKESHKDIPEIKISLKHDPKFQDKIISNSKESASIFRSLFNVDEINTQEMFYVLFLNQANKVLGYYFLSKGDIAKTFVPEKIILAIALKSLASGVILCHNHPSGNLKPSINDLNTTQTLKEQLHFFEINLLEHIILTDGGFFSFADERLL
jgi:RadC-like JAB domain